MLNDIIKRPIKILLIEDNPGDVRLTQEALKDANVDNQMQVAMNGYEALDILFKKGKYYDAITPDIILLDLNLPMKDGKEILHEIKKSSSLKRIPVVVLTTSKSEEDILKSYDLHANCYITKPIEFDKFIDVIKSIEDFWLNIVKLPTHDS